MITIVDYGMGNLGSIKNMFKYINDFLKIKYFILNIIDIFLLK